MKHMYVYLQTPDLWLYRFRLAFSGTLFKGTDKLADFCRRLRTMLHPAVGAEERKKFSTNFKNIPHNLKAESNNVHIYPKGLRGCLI